MARAPNEPCEILSVYGFRTARDRCRKGSGQAEAAEQPFLRLALDLGDYFEATL